MRKSAYFLIILVIQLTITSIAYSKKEEITTKHNEYGGKTEEKSYEPKDSKYKKKGINRIITYYNSSNIIARIDYLYTDEHSKVDGIYRRNQFFDHISSRNHNLQRAEYHYTDMHAEMHGLTKTEIEYDNDGNTSKEVFFYTQAYAKRKVYSRIEVFYEEGNPEKRVYYDINDKVILTEDKKKVWKSD